MTDDVLQQFCPSFVLFALAPCDKQRSYFVEGIRQKQTWTPHERYAFGQTVASHTLHANTKGRSNRRSIGGLPPEIRQKLPAFILWLGSTVMENAWSIGRCLIFR